VAKLAMAPLQQRPHVFNLVAAVQVAMDRDASTAIIGREGLLRLAGLAGRLRARDLAEADAPWTVKGICPPDRGSSPVLATPTPADVRLYQAATSYRFRS
jgi:hypothetical protein